MDLNKTVVASVTNAALLLLGTRCITSYHVILHRILC